MSNVIPASERVLRRTSKSKNGCWVFTGYCDKDGYGRVNTESGVRCAHRVVYEALIEPIFEGLVLDHLCENTSCVNPDHLEPKTMSENAWRGIKHKKTSMHCANGHAWTEDTRMLDYEGYLACRICKQDNVRRWRARHLPAPKWRRVDARTTRAAEIRERSKV